MSKKKPTIIYLRDADGEDCYYEELSTDEVYLPDLKENLVNNYVEELQKEHKISFIVSSNKDEWCFQLMVDGVEYNIKQQSSHPNIDLEAITEEFCSRLKDTLMEESEVIVRN